MPGNVQQCRFNQGTPAQCKNKVDLNRSGGVSYCSFHRNFTGKSGMQSSGVSLATLQTMMTHQPIRFDSVRQNGHNAMNSHPQVFPTQYKHSIQMNGWIPGDQIKWNGEYVSLPHEDERVRIDPVDFDGPTSSLVFTDKEALERGKRGLDNTCDALIKRMAVNTSNSYYEEAVGTRFGYHDGTSTVETYAGGVTQVLAQFEVGDHQHCRVTVSQTDGSEPGVSEHVRFEYPDGDDFAADIIYYPIAMNDNSEYVSRWKIDNPTRVNGEELTADQRELFETVGALRQIIGKYSIHKSDGSLLMPPGWVERDPDSFDFMDRAASQGRH